MSSYGRGNYMLRLAICDDSPDVIEQMEEYIEELKDISLEYDVFFSAEELYQYKSDQELEFDLYILDIEMESLSGLELAKKLRQESPYALIVFLTSYSQYVYDVFEVVTFDFILKPLTFERFRSVMYKASDYLHMAKLNFVFSYRKNSYSIPCQTITYIEKAGRKAFIHTNTDKTYQCNITLEDIWKQLEPRMFSPIHTSCIVNLSEIMKIVRDELTLKNGKTLYVGRNHRQEIKSRHLQFLREQI
ncbi:MAG: LytR/AlgR family response regulator transcription factor [Lachnospiraceae bacterium]